MIYQIRVFSVFFIFLTLACGKNEINPEDYPINTLNEDLVVLKEREFQDSLQLIDSFIFHGEPLGFSIESGDLYILELFSKDFYRLSVKGDILAKYPIGKGEGPNELLNPINFFFKRGKLDIVDVGNLTVKRYLLGDQILELHGDFKVKNTIYKMSKIDDEEYVFISNKKQGLDFRTIDINGKSKSIEFVNELFFPVEAAGMHYDGRMEVFGDKIYYFLMGNSKFLCFKKDKLEYIGEMIHLVPRRNIQQIGNMTRVVSFETAVFDFDVDEKFIYLLSGVYMRKLGEDTFSLDIYDATNGNYLYSYHLPFHPETDQYLPQGIKVDGDFIYVQFEEGAFAVFEKPQGLDV